MPQRSSTTTPFHRQRADDAPRSVAISIRKIRDRKNVARITLARPEHNLLNEGMLREITDAILTAGERKRRS